MLFVRKYTPQLVPAIILVFLSYGASAQNLSDAELKKNATSISEPLQKLVQLEPKSFEFNTSQFKSLQLPGGKQYGFLAEDVQQVFPELISTRNMNYATGKNTYRTAKVKTMDMESLIPILVASIKEQQAEIEKLKAELKELKHKAKP
jgi:hypothetical protein